MKRLLHLSDLHFGRVRPELLDPLIAQVNDLAPDLVAISGDLTQRARDWQFMRAREMMDRIQPPCLVVPGNHDVPLDRPIERLFFPWRRYRKWISEDLAPQVHQPGWSVIGLNSVNPLSWQRGRYSSSSLRCVRDRFADTADADFRIVVAHHPLDHRPDDEKRLTRGAKKARAALAEAGTDILLTGHLHSWRVDVFGKAPDDPAVLQVHAGTVLSSRLRGEENDFNLLTIGDGQVQIDRYANRADDSGYAMVRSARFRRIAAGWEQLSNNLVGPARAI